VSRRGGRSRAPGALDSSAARLPGPQRTCVGCRAKAARAELLRVVAVEDSGTHRLVPDPAGRLPGRGASVHLDPGCVDLADKRRAFPRALRLDGPLDLSPVREHVAARAKDHPTDQSGSSSMSTR
jgi:predicted RNA-binding protein YlxR (DUF448 family)